MIEHLNIYVYIYIYIYIYRERERERERERDSVLVFANGLGDRGSIPGLILLKT